MICHCPNLQAVPLFSTLSQETLSEISQICQVKRFGLGETVFAPGDPGGTLYLTLSGGVKLSSRTDEKESAIRLISEGESFGEISFLTQSRQTCLATALGDENRILILSYCDFRNMLFHNAALFESVIFALARRLELSHENKSEPVSHSSMARVARLLLARSNPLDGSLAPTISQAEIARTVGVRRETVARNLARLEETECLNRNRGQLVILNRKRLERVARSA